MAIIFLRTGGAQVDPALDCHLESSAMHRYRPLAALLAIAACSGPKLPSPNSAQALYDGHDQVVQVTISSVALPAAAALVSASGVRYPAPGLSLLSGPHVTYNPPPSMSLGIGGFGFSGCCGFGSGVGVGVPLGKPTVAAVSDQFITSALIPAPPDYRVNWATYHVEISTGGPPLVLSAPSPG